MLTGYIENNGRPLDDNELNTLFINAKKAFNNDAQTSLMKEIISSSYIDSYNPLHEFFDNNKHLAPDDPIAYIHSFWDCIDTPNKSYLKEFGTKWLVGMISAAYGQHSTLMLILISEEQGTGKTEFFRRLLPESLHQYYGESKLTAGKDDHILMTQRWLLMDDECAGKNRSEEKVMKALLSTDNFSLRKPYGAGNVTLKRLAVLAGTSNISEVLSDPTGNRRFIPVRISSYDFAKYNKINKDMLFICAYKLWKDGFNWEISREDAKRMLNSQDEFQVTSIERDLIMKYYIHSPDAGYFVTVTDIKIRLELDTRQKLSTSRLTAELHALGFKKQVGTMNGNKGNYYRVIEVGSNTTSVSDVGESEPDLPF
jgi:predicted P-loop ATPase